MCRGGSRSPCFTAKTKILAREIQFCKRPSQELGLVRRDFGDNDDHLSDDDVRLSWHLLARGFGGTQFPRAPASPRVPRV